MRDSGAILKKVRLLELKLRRRVRDLFAGGYQSAFKGQGMVFTDYRKYIPGDDIRAISWPLTAKMGEPHIKIFEEEKGASFILMMDVSSSLDFGTAAFKRESVVELASLIALSAQRNQDRVGLLLFSDQVEHYVPPSSGTTHILRIVRDLYSFKRKSVQTDFNPPLNFLNNVLKKQNHIFLFSDFLTSICFVDKLRLTNRRHDVVSVVICDPFEQEFPALGLMELQDFETGQKIIVDTSSTAFKKKYQELMKNRQTAIEKKLIHSQVDYFHVYTNKDIFKQLLSFVQKRRIR